MISLYVASRATFFSYNQVKVATGTFFQNCEALLVHSSARSLGRIGSSVNKGLWEMTADEANAYANSFIQCNFVTFSAGTTPPS